jgi:hypothetical protein
MDTLIKILLYLLVGLGLLTVNLWFARAVYHALLEQPPMVIAPFHVVGKDDAGGRLGVTLATMLLARLGRIREEMKSSYRALQAARQRQGQPVVQTLDVPDPDPGWVPERLFAPLDLKMTVAGVEVGGLIAWIHSALSRDSLLQVAVYYDGERAVATTHMGGSGEQSLWILAKGSDEEIVTDIAYALTHGQFARRMPEVTALERGEFKTLLSTLHRVAEVNRQVARGQAPQQVYTELLPPLEGLVKKAPSWRDLVRLTGGVAENAGDVAKAVALYQRELEFTDAKDPGRAEIMARIERLAQRIAATAAPQAAFPLNLLGVTSHEMRGMPVVAVVGGVPPADALPRERYEVVADLVAQSPVQAPPAGGDDFMSEYTLTVVQVVQLVAPQARFLFAPLRAPSGGTTMSDLLRALDELIKRRPDILLVTLGPLEGPAFERLFQAAVDAGIVVVIAAGNDPGKPPPFANTPLFKRLMVVAAADAEGGEAKFTQKAKEIFWAPGEKIPVQVQPGRPDARAGTSYAAALAAGVAARLRSEHPSTGLQLLLDTLRETSRPAKAGGPAILNLDAASGRLAA